MSRYLTVCVDVHKRVCTFLHESAYTQKVYTYRRTSGVHLCIHVALLFVNSRFSTGFSKFAHPGYVADRRRQQCSHLRSCTIPSNARALFLFVHLTILARLNINASYFFSILPHDSELSNFLFALCDYKLPGGHRSFRKLLFRVFFRLPPSIPHQAKKCILYLIP